MKLPNELLELHLTALRTKILEGKLSLFTNDRLQACLSNNDTVTFYQQSPGSESFLRTVQVAASINELTL